MENYKTNIRCDVTDCRHNNKNYCQTKIYVSKTGGDIAECQEYTSRTKNGIDRYPEYDKDKTRV